MNERDSQVCEECGTPLEKEISAPALHGFDSAGRSGQKWN
jgi:hypothetical protein